MQHGEAPQILLDKCQEAGFNTCSHFVKSLFNQEADQQEAISDLVSELIQ